jgi:excisionase family DNA binding protein
MSAPIAYSIAEACALTSAGKTALYQAIKRGALRAVKRGRRTLILDQDLRRWIEALPAVSVCSKGSTPSKSSATGVQPENCASTCEQKVCP